MSKWIYFLWPSFAAAAIGEIVFFLAINPQEVYMFGKPVYWSPMAVYSLGFFMFWGLTGLTTAIAYFFQKTPSEINGPIESRPGSALHKALH